MMGQHGSEGGDAAPAGRPDKALPRVLLSAYSCHPGAVSEPGVAWNQLVAIAAHKRYRITLLTRQKNVAAIRENLSALGCPEVCVVGVDLPAWARFWKRGHLAMHIYYYLWQAHAYLVARRLDRECPFDLAHHLSFMSVRTNMVPFLRAPSIVGPVGGAQLPPRGFGRILRHPFKEFLRSVSIRLMWFSPLWRLFVRRANLMLLANSDNLWLIPGKDRHKCVVRQIGWTATLDAVPEPAVADAAGDPEMVRIYWGGRLIGWKGLEILLRALPLVAARGVRFRLDVSGKGPDAAYLQRLAAELGVQSAVCFHGWCSARKVRQLQESCDIYCFTSLHETTGTALMEMMALGKPAVVVDHAGPSAIAGHGATLSVPVDQGVAHAVEACAERIAYLATDPGARAAYGEAAKRRVETAYGWDAYVAFIDHCYTALLDGEKSPA